MFIIAVESKKNAEKKGGMRKAYLAQLIPAPGGVGRRFARKEEALNEKNRRCFRMAARPGDVFEARRWDWDGVGWVGGIVWVGIEADGSLLALSREEAFASVMSVRLESACEPDYVPAVQRPRRIPPTGLFCRPIDPAPAAPGLTHRSDPAV